MILLQKTVLTTCKSEPDPHWNSSKKPYPRAMQPPMKTKIGVSAEAHIPPITTLSALAITSGRPYGEAPAAHLQRHMLLCCDSGTWRYEQYGLISSDIGGSKHKAWNRVKFNCSRNYNWFCISAYSSNAWNISFFLWWNCIHFDANDIIQLYFGLCYRIADTSGLSASLSITTVSANSFTQAMKKYKDW